MSAGFVLQWLVVGAAVLWAVWFVLSRFGLFGWIMAGGSQRNNSGASACHGCKACGPSKGMEKLLERIESKTSGKL